LFKGEKEKAQDELEDALSCILIAFKMLNISPEKAVLRQINKMQVSPQKIMYIYSDKVEIFVNQELKAGWVIWSADDLKEAEKMAREFNCEIIKEDRSQQLTLEINKNGKKN
jgi:hypothetical protein